MPSTWHIEMSEETKRLHLFKSGKQMKADGNFKDGERPFVGNILNVRPHNSRGKDYLVFQVEKGSVQPKALHPENFEWDRNDLTRLFRRAGRDAGRFCQIWDEHLRSHLNSDGTFDLGSALSGKENRAPTASESGRKRKRTSSTSSAVAKRHRSHPETDGSCDPASSLTDVSKIFEKHFLGQFTIPVKCLIEPQPTRLIREPSQAYITGLKEEMKKNPTLDVAPFVAMVKLREGQKFDKAHPEAFSYETIGGNHSRIALQQLLEEDEALADSPYMRSRLTSVYVGLSDEQAQHLALRHNRATEYTSKMTTQDKVHLCRMRLYTLSEKDISEEPPEKTSQWRESCAETLLMTKKQLDENMVFFLASLPSSYYKLLQEIYQMYEDGKVVKVPRAKYCIGDTKLDCRGSNFKGLRNLDMGCISDLLIQIKQGELPFMSLNNKCKEIKKLRQLKAEFVRLVGVSSWEQAQDEHPDFASEEKLRLKFLALPFTKDMPAMIGYCQKALRYKHLSVAPSEFVTMSHTIEQEVDGVRCNGAFVPLEPTAVTYTDVSNLPGFVGFPLFIKTNVETTDTREQVEAISRMAKAINTAANRVGFTIVLMVDIRSVDVCLEVLEGEGYTTDIGYWNKDKVMGSSSRGQVFASSVTPFVVAINSPEAAKANISLRMSVRSSYFTGDIGTFTNELVSLLSEKKDQVLLLNASEGAAAGILSACRDVVVVAKDSFSIMGKVKRVLDNSNEDDDTAQEYEDEES